MQVRQQQQQRQRQIAADGNSQIALEASPQVVTVDHRHVAANLLQGVPHAPTDLVPVAVP